MGNKLSIENLVDLCDTTASQSGWNNCIRCSAVYFGNNIECQYSGLHVYDGYNYSIHTELPSSGTYIRAFWCSDCGNCYAAGAARNLCRKSKSTHTTAGSGNYAICISPEGDYAACQMCASIFNTKYSSYCQANGNNPHTPGEQRFKLKQAQDSSKSFISILNYIEAGHGNKDIRIYTPIPEHAIMSISRGPKYNDWNRIGNDFGINESQWVTTAAYINYDAVRYDLIAGFRVSMGNNTSIENPIIGIDRIYYRSAKYINDTSKTFFEETNIGARSGNIIDALLPPNHILIGLAGTSGLQNAIVALHMITKNMATGEIAIKPIAADNNKGNYSNTIFLYNESTITTPISKILFRSAYGSLRAITAVTYEPEHNGLLNYCLQFPNALQINSTVRLPKTFKSLHYFTNGLFTSSTVLLNPMKKITQVNTIPTSLININPDIETKALIGINVALASNGIHIGGFKYNKYTTIDNSANFNELSLGETTAPIPISSPLRKQQIVLPQNSYICGFATYSSDPNNPSMQAFLPIVKQLSDPFTPIIIGDGFTNLANFPEFSYYYMDIPDSYNVPEKIRYIVKNDTNDVYEVAFKNITHKVWSMLDYTFAGQNALVQYKYLDKQLNGINYTDMERQNTATKYCGDKILEQKNDPETKACRLFISKYSSPALDDSINKLCVIHPNDDLCSCSNSYKNTDIMTTDIPELDIILKNNKPCYYDRCKYTGYKYTSQLDRTLTNPNCSQALNVNVCKQTVGNVSVQDSAMLKNFTLACQQAGYAEKTTTVAPPAPTPPLPTPTLITPPQTTPKQTNVAAIEQSQPQSSTVKNIVIVIFIILTAFMLIFITKKVTGGDSTQEPSIILGGYEEPDINSPDFVVV
jgi:hypothetical protein